MRRHSYSRNTSEGKQRVGLRESFKQNLIHLELKNE
jgi:hypothetical protein